MLTMGFEQEYSQAECKPVYSLEELLAWTGDNTTHRPSNLVKSPIKRFDCDGILLDDGDSPRLLVCHDMKGGYLEDRLYAGHGDPSSYTFYHWSLVEEFVYFSHHLVTVPPCCWVDAAHTHGVAIYGTLMTESTAGAATCRRLLSSESTVDAAVDRLVAVAQHHGLDGWLINIENTIDPQQVPALQYLVRRLTERMHEAVPHSRVIWYDAVTESGELRWQDQLNELNECFFQVCDGIFLNYNWTPAGLAASRQRAGPGRRRDVYVGVDVFGRGCPGGGGFNAVQPVAEARWLGLSAALFAPGWTHEVLGAARFPAAEDTLWSRLAALLPVSGPCRLPLATSFCQGRGLRRYADGQVTEDSPWHRLSLQQLQPCHLQRSRPAELPLTDACGQQVPAAFSLSCSAALRQTQHTGQKSEGRTSEQCRLEAVCAAGEALPQPGWQVLHTLEDGFSGGGCLTLHNQADRAAVFRLFSCDLAAEPGAGPSLAVMYAVKPTGDTAGDECALCVDLADPADDQEKPSRRVLLPAASSVDLSEPGLSAGVGPVSAVRPLPGEQVLPSLPPEAAAGPPQAGWITRFYRLETANPSGSLPAPVRAIGLYLPAGGSALLGYLAVSGWRGAITAE